MPTPTYWVSALPANCQIKGTPFNGVMYDAKIPHSAWANMGQEAFDELGCSLGIGRGQKYELQEDGKWLCTAGLEES